MQGLEGLNIRDGKGGTVIAVKVVPGASRDRIAGVLGDCLKITTAAAPEKGRANRAVARILASALGVSHRHVTLAAGGSSARKEFLISGLTAQAARALLKRAQLPSA